MKRQVKWACQFNRVSREAVVNEAKIIYLVKVAIVSKGV